MLQNRFMEFMWKTSAIFQKEHESRVISVARFFLVGISQSKHANVKSSGKTNFRPIFNSLQHCEFNTEMEI